MAGSSFDQPKNALVFMVEKKWDVFGSDSDLALGKFFKVYWFFGAKYNLHTCKVDLLGRLW